MRRLITILVLVALAVVGWWTLRDRQPHAPTAGPRARGRAESVRWPAPDRAAKLAALTREIPKDQISPIASALNAPQGSIHQDLEILNQLFVAWQTNFPRQGNPVGDNDEITAALAGDNPIHFAFIAPNHPAINARGELCDRWGTPFRFHQLSGTQMEIRSAGPDRRFGTADDVEFAPWRIRQ